MRLTLILATCCSLLAICERVAMADELPEQMFERQTLFTSGEGGYHTYRIPALIVTKRGTVLAFCEARKNSASDHGNVDLVMRRSENHGVTWSKPQLVHDDAEHTIGNPCPVVDRNSGTIWLPLSVDNKRVLMRSSLDDGRTWSKPRDITSNVVSPKWHWVGTGPGHGIQLKSGRLLIPCWADATPRLGEIQLSYAFFSDDAGETWKLGGAMDANASDECEAVELADGSVYMNMRSRQGKRQRASSISKDGGETWSPVKLDPKLPEPSVQGSVIRLSNAGEDGRNRVLLAVPSDPKARRKMTLRVSYDECKTWPVSKVVDDGPAAYSDLAIAQDSGILLLYESHEYKKLALVRFNAEWLTDYKEPPIKKEE